MNRRTTAIEYALIFAIVAVAMVTAITVLGGYSQ